MGIDSNRPNVLNDYAEKLIKAKARQLARRRDFRTSDDEDLAQGMRRHLLQRAHLFDPNRASINTFVARVIDSWIASLLRERRRLKRAAALDAQSLESACVAHDGETASLRDVLRAEQVIGRAAVGPEEEAARRELIAAVARLVASLPPLLRDICARLPEQSQADIKRELGLSRRQFDSAMARIRQIFTDARLGYSADTSVQDGVRNQQGPSGLGLEESSE